MNIRKKRQYYYNPLDQDKKFHPDSIYEMNFDKNEFFENSDSQKITKKIVEAHKLSKTSTKKTVSFVNLRAVYQAIGRVSSGFVSYANQKKIAEIASVSISTCSRAISWLRRIGLVKIEHRYKGKGKDRRRTSSKTTLVAFVKFTLKKIYARMRRDNESNVIKSRKNTSTPNSPRGSAVISFIYNSLGSDYFDKAERRQNVKNLAVRA